MSALEAYTDLEAMFTRTRALISFDPFRTHLPAATVLEMSAEDVPKRYVRAQPHAAVIAFYDDITVTTSSPKSARYSVTLLSCLSGLHTLLAI